MKALSKNLIGAGIAASVLAVGGLGSAATHVARAQTPGMPAGHGSLSVDHPGGDSAMQGCMSSMVQGAMGSGAGGMSMGSSGTDTGSMQACMSSMMQGAMGSGADGMGMSGMSGMSQPSGDRQTQVAANGAQIMPFDLSRTTHAFTDLPDGGRETVTANDPSDTDQIALIRSHLGTETQKFNSGDFSDPAQIHGNGMPGLAQIKAGYANIAFSYEELSNGAAINYSSSDPALVSALHTWFAAQRSDHGAHQHTP
jgi:hypothetical protein